MILKKRIFYLLVLLVISISVFAFNYSPDTWTTCLDETAAFADGTSAPVTGYCNWVGTGIQDGQEVDLTQCQSSSGGFGEANCTGNSIYYFADVQ